MGSQGLKNAYFHLALSEKLRPYVHLKVGGKVFQFDAACFGLSTLPKLWMDIMKVFEKRWRNQGVLFFIYLDDILVVGSNKKLVERHRNLIVEDLENSGMLINYEKSILEPSQKLQHLGFQVDFEKGLLQVPGEKLKSVRRELVKLLTHKSMTPRKMAAILGVVRSFLTALPFLKAFTDQMVQFTSLAGGTQWDQKIAIPVELQSQIKEVKNLLHTWEGRKMEGKVPIRTLHSDASNIGWAGVDLNSGNCVHEFWRGEDGIHINVK